MGPWMNKEKKSVYLVASSKVTMEFELSRIFPCLTPLAVLGFSELLTNKQWPKVYDLCHNFLHDALVKKYSNMQELHVFHTRTYQNATRLARGSRMSVYLFSSLTRRAKTSDKI